MSPERVSWRHAQAQALDLRCTDLTEVGTIPDAEASCSKRWYLAVEAPLVSAWGEDGLGIWAMSTTRYVSFAQTQAQVVRWNIGHVPLTVTEGSLTQRQYSYPWRVHGAMARRALSDGLPDI